MAQQSKIETRPDWQYIVTFGGKDISEVFRFKSDAILFRKAFEIGRQQGWIEAKKNS
jgi:hypothetical protein